MEGSAFAVVKQRWRFWLLTTPKEMVVFIKPPKEPAIAGLNFIGG
jgi:hypothetical protein